MVARVFNQNENTIFVNFLNTFVILFTFKKTPQRTIYSLHTVIRLMFYHNLVFIVNINLNYTLSAIFIPLYSIIKHFGYDFQRGVKYRQMWYITVLGNSILHTQKLFYINFLMTIIFTYMSLRAKREDTRCVSRNSTCTKTMSSFLESFGMESIS